MAWNENIYRISKASYTGALKANETPYSLMKEYEIAIENEDYEIAKAITDVLKPLGFNTAETHPFIPCLQVKYNVKIN